MARFPLHDQFTEMHSRIALGDRALIAIAAHVEVRAVLRAAQELLSRGLEEVLIGSYARKVSIWPGKDVDVFGRLMRETEDSIAPDVAYEMFGRALQPFADQGRLTPQARSYKIDFRPDGYPSEAAIRAAGREYMWKSAQVARAIEAKDRLLFEFSVDVVPAVRSGDHYGIPETGRIAATGDRYRTGRWRLTSPVALTDMTQRRNRTPTIGRVGAFVRTIKTVKQIKNHHLRDSKPSFLYYEFLLHDGFAEGVISGDAWADVTASALSYIASRVREAPNRPACDPVLDEPYSPAPSAVDLASSSTVLDDLAGRAARAVASDRLCAAAAEWRLILGENERQGHVFPLPPGCRETGAAMGAAAVNVASGGTAERSFG